MQFNSIRLKPEQSWLWRLLAAAWKEQGPGVQQLQQNYIMGQWLCLPITIGLQSNDDVVCLEDKIIITIISIIRKEIVIIVIIVITSSLGNWNRRSHWPRLGYRRSGNWSTVLECSSCSNITSWVSDFVCQLPHARQGHTDAPGLSIIFVNFFLHQWHHSKYSHHQCSHKSNIQFNDKVSILNVNKQSKAPSALIALLRIWVLCEPFSQAAPASVRPVCCVNLT